MTNEQISLEKYTSHTLFLKGLRMGWCWLCVRGELETGTDCHILIPSSSDYSSTSSFCWAAQPGSWGPKPSVWSWFSFCGQLWLELNSNSNWTLPALNSNKLKPSVAPGFIIVWCPPASCGHLHWIQPCPQVKVIPWYLRLDAPVIYTGASLNWQLGRGPICYTTCLTCLDGLEHSHRIYAFRPTSPCLIVKVLATQGCFYGPIWTHWA